MSRTRRSVLQVAAASWMGSAAAASARPVIDTHVHFYDPTRAQGVPWPSKNDPLLYRPRLPEAYTAMVRPLGVTGAVVVEASPWLEDNQWILDLAADNPVILALVGHLEPGNPEFRKHLARFGKNILFRGIRLNGNAILSGVENPAFLDDLSRLADAGLTLDAIGGARMISGLLRLSDRIPQLRIVIDHMPGETEGWQASAVSQAALRELAGRGRTYAKVSGVLRRSNGKVADDPATYRRSLDEVWAVFGERQVFYGSNWPVSERLAPYPEVIRVVSEYMGTKGEGATARFFTINAQNCYRLTERR